MFVALPHAGLHISPVRPVYFNSHQLLEMLRTAGDLVWLFTNNRLDPRQPRALNGGVRPTITYKSVLHAGNKFEICSSVLDVGEKYMHIVHAGVALACRRRIFAKQLGILITLFLRLIQSIIAPLLFAFGVRRPAALL